MRTRAGIVAALMIAATFAVAVADDQVKLFKVVSQKDEVVIGLTAEELHGLGTGPDLDNLARHLAADGQMTVWQYAVRKDPSGNLQQAPLKRIAIFRNDTLRLEPYATPLGIVPPGKP
jgi:hypothetical protein